jgi:ribonuclease P protein component
MSPLIATRTMNPPRVERLAPRHRMRSARDFAAVRESGTAYRGRCCLLLALPSPGEVTRLGWIASKRGVGGAVQRNRARRRIREIVRRRWPRIPHEGFLLVFIASRTALTAPHQQLATEVEGLLALAGAIAPAVVG